MEKKQLTNKNDRCFKFTFIPLVVLQLSPSWS